MEKFDSPGRGNILHMRFLRDEHNGSKACNDADPRPTLRTGSSPHLSLQRHLFTSSCIRLNRLAFERAELPHHIAQEMVPRLAPPKAFPEGRMKCPEFVKESLQPH